MGFERLVEGFMQGYRSSGYGFEERKEFVSHEESKRGFSDRRTRYNHHIRLPANHGRPAMGHMAFCDEQDSDSDEEEFFESSRNHHTNVLPHHQPPHQNFMPPPPMAQPHHHSGKMGNGWQEQHENVYNSTHGMQQRGAHEMQHYGHQNRLMAPHVAPHHAYMHPIQQHHMRVSNSSSHHHKARWGSKGL